MTETVNVNGYELQEFLHHYTGNPDFNFQESPGSEGQMETFSPYFERVQEQFRKHPNTVWTIVECDEMPEYNEHEEPLSGLLVVPGMAFVNRFLYFVSNEERKSEEEEYYW